jgi:integrase
MFSKNELMSYTDTRAVGLSRQTTNWLRKAAEILWNCTKGEISKTTVDALRKYVLRKYVDVYAKRKVINFSKAFFRYLAKTRFDSRYQAFELFLEMPKTLQERKHVTARIVTKQDIENVLVAIEQAAKKEEISRYHRINYRAIVMFGAFTGQRPFATVARLRVGHFRQALAQDKPVLNIPAECDKIRMQHYCPLHPQAIDAVAPLLDSRDDNEFIFEQLSFERWLRERKISLSQCDTRFVMSDLRKFAEQHGDIIQWDQSNKNYILTHGVSGVDWRFYKHPLPDSVYDIYMKYWKAVHFNF